eukprot:Skav221031  [mRNA]  locus=scaffold576:209066:211813:- [translate_table: standard]
MKLQVPHHPGIAFMEQPEDLGRTTNNRVPGHQPASMWQFHQFHTLLEKEEVQTVVFPQSAFGQLSVKPTRFLMKCSAPLHPSMRSGPPIFDEDGWYLGPLEKLQGAPMIGKQDGQFRTSSAAAWPPGLCQWVAKAIITQFTSNNGKRGRDGDDEGQDERDRLKFRKKIEEGKEVGNDGLETEVDPSNPPVKGGRGRPRSCKWKGSEVPFHDGGGLPSPGRWPKERRWFPTEEKWVKMRKELVALASSRVGGIQNLDKEAFKMCGTGFTLVRDESFLEEVRELMVRTLELGDGRLDVAPGQPFRIDLIMGILEAAGDPDWRFLEEAKSGFPLGVLSPLPRTPTVFERQTKWNLDPCEGVEEWVLDRDNYPSAEEHREHLRSHLDGEVEDGLMEKMSHREFVEKYGSDRAIASLAVLVEDQASGKKRVVHDATHGIGVNNRIRCVDKVRMPSAREKRALLEEYKKEAQVVISLVGDFEKAHRRFLYAEGERGFLGCRVDPKEDIVYVNRVGTFGVTSTPYWWGRISAALVRLMHYVVGPMFIEALLYADDLEVMAMKREGRIGAVLGYVALAVVGAPMKWKKQRGGMVVEWVGINTDYREYSLGLTQRRMEWVVQWIDSLVRRLEVHQREFAAGLGRLGFAALALPWERPLLGPLYAWSSAIKDQKGMMRLPWAVLFVLKWIRDKLVSGRRMEPVEVAEMKGFAKHRIWTDAKATDDRAWIGGWLDEGHGTSDAKWFSVEVDEKMAPWLRSRGGSPKRVIAALEFLATIIALKVWMKRGEECCMHTEAFTDNRGNDFILRKGLSTKFPITLMVIEVSEMLRKEGAHATLTWVRRDENEAADDLTNEVFTKFKAENRVEIKSENVEWVVMDQLMETSAELYTKIRTLKEEDRKRKVAPTESGRRTGRKTGKFFDRWST